MENYEQKPSIYPTILTLNSNDLVNWCNNRKKEMRLSNAKLAALTNVPEGTIDRILTGKNPEFRYSTIQPIIRILIGINDETPHDKDLEYYTNIIDGYKLVVENKNQVINELKKSYKDIKEQLSILSQRNNDINKLNLDLINHIKWLEKFIDEK